MSKDPLPAHVRNEMRELLNIVDKHTGDNIYTQMGLRYARISDHSTGASYNVREKEVLYVIASVAESARNETLDNVLNKFSDTLNE